MVERVTRKNENLESELPLTISAQYGLIDQNEFFDKRIASRDVSGYYLLKKGEFAYNKSTSSDAPWGAVKRLDRYEMGVLSTLYIVFALKEDGNIDSDFLVSYYDTDCWHKGVQAIAAEGARNHGLLNITPADYFETVLTVPSNVKEQHQIGTFFAKLDSLITLHQRECFSFDFSGESAKTAQKTISWEQRKVGEWGNFYYGHSCPKWSVTEDATTPCIRYGEMYTKFGCKIDRVYSYTNIPKENLKFSKGTEVLVPRVGEDPMDYNHCTWLSLANVAIGEMISVYNTEQNPLFTAIMFNATLKYEFAKRVEGGSVTNLYYEKLLEIPVSFPNIEEQKKIASFFENLDSLITLHQHKPNKKGHDVLSVMPFKGNQRKPHYLCT
jgi:type I restriction enzyme S subunit